MARDRRLFLSADIPSTEFSEFGQILGINATWRPGDDIATHPQLRIAADWPVQQGWRAFAPLITNRWIYEFSDPEGYLLILPPEQNDVIFRLATARARYPEAGLTLHVSEFLCDKDTFSNANFAPEVIAALAEAGIHMEISTHFDQGSEAEPSDPGNPIPSGTSDADASGVPDSRGT